MVGIDSIESMPRNNSVTESDLEKARYFDALARNGGAETRHRFDRLEVLVFGGLIQARLALAARQFRRQRELG